jgi:CheY-like chemotaxis protein
MLTIDQGMVRVADDLIWESAEPGEETTTSKGSGPEKPKILVVDDQSLVADTLTEILGQYGFHAFTAYGGRSALELAKKIEPEYLLTDILMPSMNGVELAIAIRNLLPQTKILLLSGQAGTADLLSKAQQQGYEFELVAKPIHPELLVRILLNKK